MDHLDAAAFARTFAFTERFITALAAERTEITLDGRRLSPKDHRSSND